jgi:hypothetical protein
MQAFIHRAAAAASPLHIVHTNGKPYQLNVTHHCYTTCALHKHKQHEPYLTDSPPQVLITRRYNVALVLPHALAQAVISVGALVSAGDALNARVLGASSSSSSNKIVVVEVKLIKQQSTGLIYNLM